MDESWMPCPAILRALSGRPSQEGIPFSVFSGTLTPLINHVILPLLPTPTPSGHPQRSGGQGRGASVGGVPDLLWPPPDLLVPWGAAAPPAPERAGAQTPPQAPGGQGRALTCVGLWNLQKATCTRTQNTRAKHRKP